MTVETRTCITEIRTVGVPVTGQDHALEFYVGKLVPPMFSFRDQDGNGLVIIERG